MNFFDKLAQFGRGFGRGRGMRNFGKTEVERFMTHYNVSYKDAIKMLEDGKASLPPVGTRRRGKRTVV